MLFAHLKRILKLDRLRLRSPAAPETNSTWRLTAQNLRKLAKHISRPQAIPATWAGVPITFVVAYSTALILGVYRSVL
jgi:hypothetical protein